MGALSGTIRVHVDGTIVRGIKVPHKAANLRGRDTETRYVAAPPRRARTQLFRRDGGVPADVWIGDRRTDILGVTMPHDCGSHITGGDL